MKKNIFSNLMDKLNELPLWVKECVYVQLQEDLNQCTLGSLPASKGTLLQYYKPIVTYIGTQELKSRNKDHSPNLYRFLEGAAQGLNILEITLNNYWTLEEISAVNVECIDNQYVAAPENSDIKAMALYCAGKIKIGDYLKRINLINIDQLDAAIRKQKELEASGKWVKMVELMIQMGFVTEENTQLVLLIKEESRKRFILSTDIVDNTKVDTRPDNVISMNSGDAANGLPSDIDAAAVVKLVRENKILKTKIKDIISVIQGK